MTDLNFIPELPDLAPRAWMRDALCAKMEDLDAFFPAPGPWRGLMLWEAKSVCDECPVFAQCNARAIETMPYSDGVAAGRFYDSKGNVEEIAMPTCPDGHEMTEENTYVHRARERRCRACGAAKTRAARAARKEAAA